MKFLVVDDSEFSRRIIANTIRDLGYFDIEDAIDGVDAINKINQNKYDLVTIDLVMPKSHGKDVIVNIKEISPGTRILVCSSVSNTEAIREVITLGIDDFIVKPFNSEKLKERLQALIIR